MLHIISILVKNIGKHSQKYFVRALNKGDIHKYVNLAELLGCLTMDVFHLTYQSSVNQFECRWCYLSSISIIPVLWRWQGRVWDLIYFLLYKAKFIMFHFLWSRIFSQPNYEVQGFFVFCVCVYDEHFSNFIHNLL